MDKLVTNLKDKGLKENKSLKLEQLTDPDMAIFIDKSLIGGISAILSPLVFANNPQMGKLNNPTLQLISSHLASKPCACADNPQMGKLYDPSKPLNTILYVDANNLYGWAMSQYLPTGGFEWVEVSEIDDWVDFMIKQGE